MYEKAKVKQDQCLVGAGALGGVFLGMLIGLLLWIPWLGLAIGAHGSIDPEMLTAQFEACLS